MYNSLFRISDESICGMDFHSGLQKNWASNTAINTKPEAHPCFSGPHIGPWPSTHFQGLEPPTITTFKSSVIQKAPCNPSHSEGQWKQQVLPAAMSSQQGSTRLVRSPCGSKQPQTKIASGRRHSQHWLKVYATKGPRSDL